VHKQKLNQIEREIGRDGCRENMREIFVLYGNLYLELCFFSSETSKIYIFITPYYRRRTSVSSHHRTTPSSDLMSALSLAAPPTEHQANKDWINTRYSSFNSWDDLFKFGL